MLDPKLLRNDLDLVVTQLERKGVEFDVSAYQALEAKRKWLQLETESLQNQRKDGSKSVGLLMKEGQKEAAEALKVEISGIGDQLAAIEARFHEVQSELDRILMESPNLPDASVPEGADEKANVEVALVGDKPAFDFAVRDHIELGELFAGLDFDRAARLSGSRFDDAWRFCEATSGVDSVHAGFAYRAPWVF